jgi:hypothetical protein
MKHELTEWAITVRELEILEAITGHGSYRKAARSLGCSHSTVTSTLERIRARQARQDIAAHRNTEKAPVGFAIKGTTTLQDGNGAVRLQWIKTDRDEEKQAELMRQFVTDLCEGIKGTSPKIDPPTYFNADLLACYPIGDHHHGMRSDAEETGANYDCKIASSSLESAFDYLTSISPPAETGLLINLGDYYHANDSTNETPGHGNRLDVDSRYGKTMYSGAMALIQCILKLLAKHQKVIVWMMPGNHDPDAAFALAMAVSFYFHNEPRVTVDLGRSLYKYHLFGKNLVASHHGHGAKAQDLPLIMASDMPDEWAKSVHRVWHCGHIHHKTVKEMPGCTVETHRTLAPPDSWHHGKGYRSKQDMNAIVYHREHGEIQRSRFDVAMLA